MQALIKNIKSNIFFKEFIFFNLLRMEEKKILRLLFFKKHFTSTDWFQVFNPKC